MISWSPARLADSSRLIEPGAPRELAGCLIDEDLFAAGCVECVVPTRANSVELLERQGPDARD
jgi:hypothetical protein